MTSRKLSLLVVSLAFVGMVGFACARRVALRRDLRKADVPTSAPTSVVATPTTTPALTLKPLAATSAVTASTEEVTTVAPISEIDLEEPLVPEETEYPHNHWSNTELPELTYAERVRIALRAGRRSQEYTRVANAGAQELSDDLERHIRAWLRGEADAKLPKGLLPPYVDSAKTKDWTLMRPDEVDPSKQWFIIAPVHEIDPEYKRLYMFGVDRHVTYLKLIFLAPFGSKLLVEGDFPHARFMDYEILPPFDPEHPSTGTMGETPEVPIVDVDIEPDPGHVNPFRVGADRNATNRHYHLTFDLSAGNAVELNPQAMKAPEYRAPGNTRVGGPFGFAGHWGDGAFVPSVLWLRIYVPDEGTEPLGGVSVPRVILQLPSGEEFWLQPDATLAIERQTTRVAAGSEPPLEPYPFIGPHLGWRKIYGLSLIRAENQGYRQSEPWGPRPEGQTKQLIRRMFMLLFNRGTGATPPGNYESAATMCNYNSFITRMFQFGPGKVYAITGRLPTTPKTHNGESTMTGAEARYWSISQYGRGEGDKYETAVHYGSLMDDEIVVNGDNDYIILYSSEEDRPSNARPECGVTWQDRGPRPRQTITIRWMSIMPEWHLPEFAPDEYNIPWSTGAWSEESYDESLLSRNVPGVMGPYHPVIHYLTKTEFEALGCPIDPSAVPEWK